MNLIDYLDRGASIQPERACFLQDGRTITYRDTRDLTLRVAAALRAAGFEQGEAGAVLSPNDAVAFTCALGIVRAGGIWASANPRTAIDETAYLLDHFECGVLFYHSAFEAFVPELRKRCPRIRIFVCLDRAGASAPSLEDWLRPFKAEETIHSCNPDATVVLAATGGTTGRPKGIMLSNRNMETFVANVLAALQFEAPPVYLAAAPLTHAAGTMVLALMAIGGTTVVQTRVEPQEILKAIAAFRVNVMLLPPTVIYVLLSQKNVRDFDYSSLKYFVYVASPISAEKLREAIEVFGPVMTQLYGQAEAPMTLTYMSPADHVLPDANAAAVRLRSCGRPMPFVRLAIMDDGGALLPPGEVGEIVAQGDLVMKGYLKDPAATAESRLHGWHHTGDVGYRDADGFYYIVDRKKDMIITGGFNVYPNEIEQVIAGLPAVLDCAVIGVPDEKWGEAVKAVVQLRPGGRVEAEDVIAVCKQKLGSVKAPKTVEFVDELPRSPVGKVLKKALKAKSWAGRERMVN
jgi:acyl-CoA synthetase (AMP-forming)/AMP-acid ligase II